MPRLIKLFLSLRYSQPSGRGGHTDKELNCLVCVKTEPWTNALEAQRIK